MQVDVFKDMNPAQQEAIACLEGPLLVVAGAGSGKTRVITHRIANIIQRGTRPDRILAITFTNKAAGEMQERVHRLLGLKTPWITTFHSAGLRLLKLESARLGLAHPFTIMDEEDQGRLYKRVLRQLQIEDADPRAIARQISDWKNHLVRPEDIVPTDADMKIAKEVWVVHREICKVDCVMDFDDLLMLPVQMLEADPELRAKYQERFPYILIDEYQDTNHAQYRLVQLLGAHRNVCATGDPDQAIYGWRGADINNILDFERDFPGCRTVLLEQNYRSTKTILRAAQGVIENNLQRKNKTIFTENDEGRPLSLVTVPDEVDESLAIAARIDTLRKQGRPLRDMAVFYRTNVQARILEDGLRRRAIPYRILGGTRFYDRREIKDLLCYLRLLVNPMDLGSFARIVNIPRRGIGEKTLQLLLDLAEQAELPWFQVLADEALLDRIAIGRNGAPLRELRRVWLLLQTLPRSNPVACIEGVITMTGLEDHYISEDDSEEGHGRVANLHEIATAAAQLREVEPEADLVGFLDHVALVTVLDNKGGQDQDQATLMTLHGAKGLEFPVIFITGCEEGVFPLDRSGVHADIEEERRLMYVGLTRAKEEIYLSRAERRMQFGQTNRNHPSVFLAEIPPECFGSRAAPRSGRSPAPARAFRHADPGVRAAATIASRAGSGLMTGEELRRHQQKAASAGDLDDDLPDVDIPDEALTTAEADQAESQESADGGMGDDPDTGGSVATGSWTIGQPVIHSTLGRGMVAALTGDENDPHIVIDFDRGGRKELVLTWCIGRLSGL